MPPTNPAIKSHQKFYFPYICFCYIHVVYVYCITILKGGQKKRKVLEERTNLIFAKSSPISKSSYHRTETSYKMVSEITT